MINLLWGMNLKEYKINPKALNLSAVNESDSKVTLGFKCDPKLKIQLAEIANLNGLTLSSYVESYIKNAQGTIEAKNQICEKLKSENSKLIIKVNFYENSLLKELFNQYKDRTISYIKTNGQKVNLKIMTIEDVYTVIINSFK